MLRSLQQQSRPFCLQHYLHAHSQAIHKSAGGLKAEPSPSTVISPSYASQCSSPYQLSLFIQIGHKMAPVGTGHSKGLPLKQ